MSRYLAQPGDDLDDLDRRLISFLRVDGRAPLARIAAALRVSRATVQNRLDRLAQRGVIAGYTVRVRSDAEAGGVRAVMMIEVAGKTTSAVIRTLRGLPEVNAIHTTNGSWDLVADIQAGSLPDFDRVLREVRTIDGITNTETSILLATI